MRIANLKATRHATAWLIALTLAAVSLFPGAATPVQAQSTTATTGFQCHGAADYVRCNPPWTFTTTQYASITIQVIDHASGGEVCYLADNWGIQRTGVHWIDYGSNAKYTFAAEGGGLPPSTTRSSARVVKATAIPTLQAGFTTNDV